MIFASVIVLTISCAVWFLFNTKSQIPNHLLGHKVLSVPQIISPENSKKLNAILRELRNYPTNVNADLKTGYTGCTEEIGEAIPILPSGKCPNPLLVPNMNKSSCILPQRVDVGKHFISTGGPDAIREDIKAMTTRVQSFAQYLTKDAFEKYPIFSELFGTAEFINSAKAICPADAQVLDPFQFSFILQIPGQTVATHVDAPYFWGANRCNVPQWLLASMLFSNLFHKLFINQVQVVGYIHEWSPKQEQQLLINNHSKITIGGDFIYYDTADGSYKSLNAEPLSGNVVDGSKTVHAAKVYRPDIKAPFINKDKNIQLVYQENEIWYLLDKDTNEKLAEYTSNQLRISLVYRARCFSSEEEKLKYKNFQSNISISNILEVFINDLILNGKLSIEDSETIGKLELASLIMENYIKYPMPTLREAWIPFNYCALPLMFPWLNNNSVYKYICDVK